MMMNPSQFFLMIYGPKDSFTYQENSVQIKKKKVPSCVTSLSTRLLVHEQQLNLHCTFWVISSCTLTKA